MASLVEIYNRALSRIGARRVTAPGEDSNEAKSCTSAWPMVRDEVLRSHPWNCAIRREELAADATAPIWEYAYSYTLPADTLRILEIESGQAYPWVVEGGRILTDAPAPLNIRLIFRQTDTQQYDALLASALSARLAAEIAHELTGASAPQVELLTGIYSDALRRARAMDAMESSPAELAETSWTTARY